jgi:hypothetical protein
MFWMGRVLRSLAAILAGLALVAALPAPCGCAPERSASPHADEHACCAPPVGVSAADEGCCDQTPDPAEALLFSVAPAGAAPTALATLPVATPFSLRVCARPSVPLASSPPPTVLRI